MPAQELSRRPDGPAVAVLRALVLLGSAGFVVLYAALVYFRIGYPFELEWLEGTAVDHVRTILAGEPLYAKPSLSFTPLTYTPGYFYLAAALSAVIGEGFLPLRLISVCASAGVLVLIFAIASREARHRDAGIVAAGLFAGTYGWTDGWFDLARNDSLMLLLALAAIYTLRYHPSARGTLFAGVLISLCFLVKQTGFIIAIPLSFYCALRGWRSFVTFTATVAVLVLGTTLVLERVFDGWYLYYVVDVPGQHPLAFETLWKFWRFDLARPLPLALMAAPVYVLWRMRHDREAGLFYLAVGAALFGGALASRLHSLSYINVLLPAYAALAILSGIATQQMRMTSEKLASPRRLAPTIPYALTLLQLIRLGYAPAPLVPTAEDVAAGRLFLERLALLPGVVFVPYHGYLPSLAARPSQAHAVTIADVIRGGTTHVEKDFAEELAHALRSHRFDSIVSVETPTPVRGWLNIEEFYRPAERIVDRRSRFWRPEVRYVPR
jgi:hypothetical protein